MSARGGHNVVTTYGLIITIPIANAILVAVLGLIQNVDEGARDSLSPEGLLLQ